MYQVGVCVDTGIAVSIDDRINQRGRMREGAYLGGTTWVVMADYWVYAAYALLGIGSSGYRFLSLYSICV